MITNNNNYKIQHTIVYIVGIIVHVKITGFEVNVYLYIGNIVADDGVTIPTFYGAGHLI